METVLGLSHQDVFFCILMAVDDRALVQEGLPSLLVNPEGDAGKDSVIAQEQSSITAVPQIPYSF